MTETKLTEYTGKEVLLSKNWKVMTSNGSTPAPKTEATKNNQGLKSWIVKGAVGAVSIAGTTAIPLMVQKYFSAPPAPAVQASPVQVAPILPPTQVQPESTQSSLMQVELDDEKPGNRKGQKKSKN